MRKIILMVALTLSCFKMSAQHFYHRMDVSTSNIYTFVAANLATAGLNALTDDMLFDNAYSYTYYNLSSNTLKTKMRDITGLTARDLFSDVMVGAKLGYQSFSPGSFNWGVYGSAHYKTNQFGTKVSDAVSNHCIQKAMLGGGVMFTLGNIESNTRVIIEAGLRYDVPLSYKGAFGTETKDVLNSGLSSHYAIRFGGTSWLQGIGVYADIPHYNALKDAVGCKLKMYHFGIVYTISPWKLKESYD